MGLRDSSSVILRRAVNWPSEDLRGSKERLRDCSECQRGRWDTSKPATRTWERQTKKDRQTDTKQSVYHICDVATGRRSLWAHYPNTFFPQAGSNYSFGELKKCVFSTANSSLHPRFSSGSSISDSPKHQNVMGFPCIQQFYFFCVMHFNSKLGYSIHLYVHYSKRIRIWCLYKI